MSLRIHRPLRMSNQHLGRLLKPDEGNVVANVGILVLGVNVNARGLDDLGQSINDVCVRTGRGG